MLSVGNGQCGQTSQSSSCSSGPDSGSGARSRPDAVAADAGNRGLVHLGALLSTPVWAQLLSGSSNAVCVRFLAPTVQPSSAPYLSCHKTRPTLAAQGHKQPGMCQSRISIHCQSNLLITALLFSKLPFLTCVRFCQNSEILRLCARLRAGRTRRHSASADIGASQDDHSNTDGKIILPELSRDSPQCAQILQLCCPGDFEARSLKQVTRYGGWR